MKALSYQFLLIFCFSIMSFSQEVNKNIPVNKWVKVGECPIDLLERDVPSGRGSSWVYNSDKQLFYRYGGFTPRYSNALQTYDPATQKWAEIFSDDENYPDTRPGGVAAASLGYDKNTKKLWISGGFYSGYVGKIGIWQYDIEKNAFVYIADLPPGGVRRIAYAFDKGVAVCSPAPMANYSKNALFILDLKTGNWERKNSEQSPHEAYRGNYPIVYHQAAQKMVVVGNPKDKIETYILDMDSYQWEKLDIEGPPGVDRTFYNLMYEPRSKMVFLFGGHNARDAAYYGEKPYYYNDTWVFDLEKKEWKELKVPGPSTVVAKIIRKDGNYDVLTYSHAYDYDEKNQCILFSDPDRGVWAFKYDATKPIETDMPKNESIPAYSKINFSPMNFSEPLEEGVVSKELLRALPVGLSEKLQSLSDNALVSLAGKSIGGEVAWAYSPKHGVFFKYGGCGHHSAPFWGGYGNDLEYYDPVVERAYARRIGDVSGAHRPGTGCTRSIVWDSKREIFWFLGGTASGPFVPTRPSENGVYAYNPSTDQIVLMPRTGKNTEVFGHHTYLSYDADVDIFVAPQNGGKTAHFICEEARWELVDDTNSPGPLINYSRTVYVNSQRKIFMIYPMETGKQSEKKPEDFAEVKDAAGKKENIWVFDKKDNQYKEKKLGTFLYDAKNKKWEKIDTKGQPNYRESKYGMGYDPYNDIVFLVGGHIGWNGPVVNDMWAYHVQKKEWEKLKPAIYGNSKLVLSGCLKTDFDTRHNVLIFSTHEGKEIWAYRYKNVDVE